MTPEPDAMDNPLVLAAAREYLSELEAGRTPDRLAYLDRHPEFAEAIAECLDGIDLLYTVGRPVNPPSRTHHSESLAEPLGDFRIIREVGRGGMGVVYEAVQLSLGRRVALKVLPFAAALDARHLQRFRTEAHAAAQLHHTNIVPVYAVGCERGMHFYAMQIIDGRPLDAVIRELRDGIAESSGSQPTVELRAGTTVPTAPQTGSITRAGRGRASYRLAARLAAQVADALEYAHDAGVVHRDVKPANLLLDGKGNVWVTDFGLAQVVADVGLTQTGDVLGTLRYMSPEQAAGRRTLVDHRTDIYSLGATLYELLALEPIFAAEDRQALLHHILNDDPRPLRSIDRGIPVELETIVLKAVAKTPSERYTTAGELASDLRRFLDDRPILARRPTVTDQVRKWARRHPSVVGAGVLVLMLGLIGLAVSTAVVAQEQKRTEEAYNREKQRSDEAEQRFQLARRSADKLLQLAQDETADNPQLEGMRKRLLETALGYYQELIQLRGDDPAAQADLAATRDQVKQVLADLAVLQGDRHLVLLGEADVREDLRLARDQRERLDDHLRHMNRQREESFPEFHKLAPDERSRRFLELARANDAGVGKILTPDQFRRLRQVALQLRGPSAFRDSTVIDTLKITPEQRERMRVVEIGEFPPKDGSRRGPGGPPWRDPDPQAAVGRMLTALNPVQLAAWKELIGEPYTGRRPFFPGPPRSPNDHGGPRPMLPRPPDMNPNR